MSEQIGPGMDPTDVHPDTSLERAHSMAVANLDRAKQILATAKADGDKPERIAQLEGLLATAEEDLVRARNQL